MHHLIFQKQSPFVDDMNKIINMAKQVGVIQNSYYKNLPNATKCKTIHDVYKSHAEKNRRVIVDVNDIYGMLLLLGLGVAGAVITFTAEFLTKRRCGSKTGFTVVVLILVVGGTVRFFG